MSYSTIDKVLALKRELKWRQRVYPNRVLTGRMTQLEATRQIRIFEEILSEYQEREKAEHLL